MTDRYESPLSSRYASAYMLNLFSQDVRYQTWRRLWVSLARAEHKLGLGITEAQIKELEDHITDIDYEVAAQREKLVRHDVMAHVYAYGQVAPSAAGIIHLGATSCYVGDNTDILQMRDGLLLVRKLLVNAVAALRDFAEKYKALPTLAYTHFQAAQPTTKCQEVFDALFRAGLPLAQRPAFRYRAAGLPAGKPAASGLQGYHRHRRQLSGAL